MQNGESQNGVDKRLPVARGQSCLHALTGLDCVNWPTLSSIKNVGIPANMRQIRNGIRNAPEMAE